MQTSDYKRATKVGCAALLLWCAEPLLVSEVTRLPIFETLAIIFFSAFALTSVRITYRKNWSAVLRQSPIIWVIGTIGLCFSDFAYVYGIRFAPIDHVELIDYLWPCLVIIFTGLLPKERFLIHTLFGGLLGVLGVLVLINQETSEIAISSEYYFGYLLAFGGACIWASYSAFSRYFKEIPTEMIGMYCGVGAIMSLGLHLGYESFVMPTLQEGSFCVLTGILGLGLAYQLWDHGVKFGNVYLLGALTYFARIFTMVCLVSFGKAPLTISLIIACILSTLGAYICSLERINFQAIRNFFIQMGPAKSPQHPARDL